MRSRIFIAFVAAIIVALSVPAAAVAVDAPTILTAGINDADQFYATWSLGAGTSYDHISFATSPEPDPETPEFFLSANFAGFGCGVPPQCDGTPTSTSFWARYPIARDRRYFVKVAAQVPGAPGVFPTSAVWIIDETKPLIAGKAPIGAIAPTNSPATGRLLAAGVPPAPPPPPPPATRPTAKFTVTRLPRTFAALRLSGVGLRITCRAACSATGSLALNGVSIGRRSTSFPRAGTRTISVKLSAAGRRRMGGRSRARLKISAAAKPVGGFTVRGSRYFTAWR